MPAENIHRLFKPLLPLLVLALAMLFVMLLWMTREDTTARPQGEAVWSVDVVTVSPGAKRPTITLHGNIESSNISSVSAAVQADVKEVVAREGDRFEAGDLLVKLDASNLEYMRRQRQAQVEELDAQLALEEEQRKADKQALANERAMLKVAERDYNRQKRLESRGSGTETELDAAEQQLYQRRLSVSQRELAVRSYDQRIRQLEARIEQAQANLEQVEHDIERTAVRAPFDGRVANVEVGPGTQVNPGAPLVQMYDTSALQVRANLSGEHLERIQHALQQQDALPATGQSDGLTFPVMLRRLGGQSQPGQAGVEALFDVERDIATAVLGRFATVDLPLPAQENVVAVPYQAIYGNNRIYRIADGRMQRVDVTRIGDKPSDDGRRFALVRADGLEDGDRVVATQIPQAANGVRVSIADEGGAADSESKDG